MIQPIRFSQSIKITLLAASVVWLTACSPMQTPQTKAAPKASAWKSWEATGIVGFRDSKQASSAHFDWQQHSETAFDLRLQGVMGIGALAIHATSTGVSAKNAQGKTVSAATPEALVAEQTGWQLPVSDLYYWLRGIPVPGLAVTSSHANPNGQLTQLQQAGWTVVYQSYTQAGSAVLPSRIILTQPQLTVTVIVNQWQYQ